MPFSVSGTLLILTVKEFSFYITPTSLFLNNSTNQRIAYSNRHLFVWLPDVRINGSGIKEQNLKSS